VGATGSGVVAVLGGDFDESCRDVDESCRRPSRG
jgi:hypothetical protein